MVRVPVCVPWPYRPIALPSILVVGSSQISLCANTVLSLPSTVTFLDLPVDASSYNSIFYVHILLTCYQCPVHRKFSNLTPRARHTYLNLVWTYNLITNDSFLPHNNNILFRFFFLPIWKTHWRKITVLLIRKSVTEFILGIWNKMTAGRVGYQLTWAISKWLAYTGPHF